MNILMNKPRIIVFATGWACNRFLINCKEDYNILALSDWDVNKHGSYMQGVEIISPYCIKDYNYDYIVIASQYVNQIMEQLLNRCGIGEETILIPYKNQLKYGKPFKDPITRAFGRRMIVYLTNLMKENKINIYLDFGTLLGVVRNSDIIEWDDDIDFSIKQNDVKRTVQVLYNERKNMPYSHILEWNAVLTKDENNNIWGIALLFSNQGKNYFNEFEIGIRVRKNVDNHSIGMLGRYNCCHAKHFDKYDIVTFENQEIMVPYQHKKYLDFVYGEWRKPKIYGFNTFLGSTEVEDLEKHKIKEIKEKLF